MRVVVSMFESLADSSPPCKSDRTVEIRAFKKSVTRCRHQWGSPDAAPEKHWPELDRQLSAAYHESDYETAKRSLETTAKWLGRLSPDAAASLREGLEETLTVVKLGLPGALAARWRRPTRLSRR